MGYQNDKKYGTITTTKDEVDYQFWYPRRNKVIKEYKINKDNYSSADETDGELIYQYLGNYFYEYPQALIKKYQNFRRFSLEELLEFEKELTQAHLDTIQSFCKNQNISRHDIDLIGFHGQTLYHNPEKKITLQIGNPNILTANLGIDVVADFRRRDIENGGQGAPLVPFYHKAIIDASTYPSAVVNIGGISNITLLDHKSLTAFDSGPGNALLNDFIASFDQSHQYDIDGTLSANGKVDFAKVDAILSDEFFNKKAPKSLDRNFITWNEFKYLNINDGAATICFLIAKAISQSIPGRNNQIFICGGGRKNPTIMKFLTELTGTKVSSIDKITDQQGRELNGDFIESQAFAYLAARIKYNLPIADANTTGTKYPAPGGAFYQA